MLKVAHIVRRFTFEEWGGTESVVWNSVLNLTKLGVKSEILATAALSIPGEELRSNIRIRRFPYKYPYIPMPAKDKLALDKKGGNPETPKLIAALKSEKYDIVHIHTAGRLAQQSLRAAKEMGIPALISLHGGGVDVPQSEITQMMRPTRGKFHYGGILDRFRGLRGDILTQADALICLGSQEERALRQRYPQQRIFYLPNGVQLENFQIKDNLPDIRQEWNIPEDREIILCISRIDYQKDQKILVSLLGNLLAKGDNAHLLLIGPVTVSQYYEELLQLAENLQVADHLTVIPGLPPGDPRLTAALHSAKCFILPSRHEPFGIAALEAWAAGTPLIASDAGGLKDFIRDQVNGLSFPAGNLELLQQAYEKLTIAPDLVKQAAMDVQNYTWPVLMKKLFDLYQELINVKKS